MLKLRFSTPGSSREISKSPEVPDIVGFKGPSTGSGQGTYKILIVDDHLENWTLLKDVLSPLGLDLVEAADGREALTIVKEYHPDLILMDLLMPVMDGFEATRQIRELESRKSKVESQKSNGSTPLTMTVTLSEVEGPASSIQHPVIIGVSATVSSDIRQESTAAGCSDFLAKPVQIDALLDCLRRHLGLEWIYDDSSESDSEKSQVSEVSPLVVPPQDVLMGLLQLAQGGRITNIREAIAKMKAATPSWDPFATRIEQLVDNFQFDRIVELIKSSIANET